MIMFLFEYYTVRKKHISVSFMPWARIEFTYLFLPHVSKRFLILNTEIGFGKCTNKFVINIFDNIHPHYCCKFYDSRSINISVDKIILNVLQYIEPYTYIYISYKYFDLLLPKFPPA